MLLSHEELRQKIIEAFFMVYNNLGHGFLENVYQNSLYLELKNRGLKVETQQGIKVYYKGNNVGNYFADMIVNDCILLEIKATDALIEKYESQLINYLKATDIEVRLLLNFGPKAEFIRKVFSNKNK